MPTTVTFLTDEDVVDLTKEFIITVNQPAYILDGDVSGITSDKTFAEIIAAINAGRTPVVRLKTQGKIEVDMLHLYKSASMAIVFRQQVKHTADYNIVSTLQCIFNMAGGISVDSVNFRSVPDCDEEGKLLVSDGVSHEWRNPNELAGIAPPIIPTATGEVISISDSANRRLSGLRLYGKTTQVTTTGKNLMPVNSLVTYRNRSISVGSQYYIEVNPNSEYTLSLKAAFGGDATGYYVVVCGTADGTSDIIDIISESETRTTFDTGNRSGLYIDFARVGGGDDTNGWAEYTDIQLELGSTATSYEPYTGGAPSPSPNYPQPLVNAGDSGSIGVKASGKNLFDFDDWKTSYSPVRANVTCGQESVTITALENDAYALAATKVNVVGGKTYTISFDVSDNNIFKLNHLFKNGIVDDSLHVHYATRYTFTADDDAKFYTVRFGVPEAGNTVTFSNIMFNEGSTALPYEPFKNGGSLTASTPNGLPGIKVASGGNYMDENGHQWVCDEKDYERGVYVQRVQQLVLTGTESWLINNPSANNYVYYIKRSDVGASECLCDKFTAAHVYELHDKDNIVAATAEYGGIIYVRSSDNMAEDTQSAFKAMIAQYTPTVMYILATPIETPIPESEMAAYRAMKSQYPNTTVCNDAGAGMAVDYIADTKNYIDQKLAAISAALLNK